MKTLSYLVFAASLTFFTACSESDTKQAEETQSAPTAPVSTGTENNAAGQSQLPADMPAAAGSGSATGPVNPAHGEPGHRCDISVGAPLNSAPSSPAATQQVITPQQPASNQPAMQQQPSAPAAGGKGKVNPAHGEPGHDCAKSVGAPL